MKRRPLVTFFVAAFVLPWFVWGTSIAQTAGLIGWHIPESLAFWLGLPVATYGTAAITGGWPAVRDLLLRLIRVKVNWFWYVVAIGLPVTMGAALVALGLLLGSPPQVGVLVPAGALVGALLLNTWEWLITEETAWRGFALPRLQRRFDPLIASLVLGVLWGVWHLPLFFIPGSFQSSIPFVGFLISTIATSVTIGWVFNRAQGSVLVVALFHGFTDVVIAYTGVMTSGAVLFWITVGLQVLVAAAVGTDLRRRDLDAASLPAGTALLY